MPGFPLSPGMMMPGFPFPREAFPSKLALQRCVAALSLCPHERKGFPCRDAMPSAGHCLQARWTPRGRWARVPGGPVWRVGPCAGWARVAGGPVCRVGPCGGWARSAWLGGHRGWARVTWPGGRQGDGGLVCSGHGTCVDMVRLLDMVCCLSLSYRASIW